jgi:hypothetical protein
LEAKRCVIYSRARVFTGTKEKEESDTNHVCDGYGCHVASRIIYHIQDVNDNDDGHRLDPPGRIVTFLVRVKLSLDPEIDVSVMVLPWVSPPSLACAWPTACRASSTVRDLMALCKGARSPSRYRSPKTWIIGMGSSHDWRYGYTLLSKQKCSHRPQCLSMA